MSRKKPLSEQVVVIGGGSYGLGRAIAERAKGRGARVVIGARTQEALESAAVDLAVDTDVADRAQVERLGAAAVDQFGRIDTYIANAMVTVYSEAHRLEDEELRRVFDVNFFGGVYGYWAALPHLRSSRGTYVQIGSALSYRGIPLQAAYCSSKAALRTFFESARVEHQKHGIPVDVSVVLPGAINTPQFDMARQYVGKQPQPVPPIYEPEPFAEGVVHCFEDPIREWPLGWGPQKLLWGQKLSPRAGDFVLRRNGWKGQHTGEDKPVGSPDNLFAPLPGDKGARGRFASKSRPSTAWTSLRLRRWLLGTALVGVGLATMGATN